MKPFTTSLLGSMPRSQALLMARKKHALGKITTAELEQIVVQETKQIVELQQRTGIDIITSGELLRDNYLSFIAQKIQGATLMSMSEMLDHIKEKQIFESMLETLDVPALSIKNAICVGKISYKQSLVADEMLLLKNLTKQPIKGNLARALLNGSLHVAFACVRATLFIKRRNGKRCCYYLKARN